MPGALDGIKEGEVILFLIPAKKYVANNLQLLKHYVNKLQSYCIYITVNKPYAALIKTLQNNGVNTKRMFFIDAVTPSGTAAQKAGNVVFIGSAQGLTTISLAITSAVKSMPKGKRVLFLDSVSTLILYNNAGTVSKFSRFLITKMKKWNVGGAIMSLEKESDEDLVGQLSQLCDNVIEMK